MPASFTDVSLPTEIVTALITLFISTLTYLINAYIQQRNKKNTTLRLIGTVYKPLHYFIDIKYAGIIASISLLTSIFYLFFSLSLSFIFSKYTNYIIKSIILISLIVSLILSYVTAHFSKKGNEVIEELIDEIPGLDIDGLIPRWKAVFLGASILAYRYFLIIFTINVSIAIAVSFLNNSMSLGLVLVIIYIGSLIISLLFMRFIVWLVALRFRTMRLRISLFDSSTEIESNLFNVIKEPSICVCLIDDKGDKYCGTLESMSYNVSIRREDRVLVSMPYEHVYKIEECKAKGDNSGSIPQPYL
jgi:hypothetical protein